MMNTRLIISIYFLCLLLSCGVHKEDSIDEIIKTCSLEQLKENKDRLINLKKVEQEKYLERCLEFNFVEGFKFLVNELNLKQSIVDKLGDNLFLKKLVGNFKKVSDIEEIVNLKEIDEINLVRILYFSIDELNFDLFKIIIENKLVKLDVETLKKLQIWKLGFYLYADKMDLNNIENRKLVLKNPEKVVEINTKRIEVSFSFLAYLKQNCPENFQIDHHFHGWLSSSEPLFKNNELIKWWKGKYKWDKETIRLDD